MSYILLGFVKILDNMIMTAKSIATYKEQRLLSSILVTISQLIFYLVISQVLSDNTIFAIVIVSISSGVGNYIAFLINDKVKSDTKWNIVLTSSNKDDVMSLCNYLKNSGIKYIANDGYTRDGRHTVNVIAFSKSKSDSRAIDKYLENTDHKYLKEVI